MRYTLHQFKDVNAYSSNGALQSDNKKIVLDHVIPHSIMMDKFIQLEPLSHDNLLRVVKNYLIFCRISHEEDKCLNQAGLRSKMPCGWDEYTGDTFARYNAVGIVVTPATRLGDA